MKETLSIPLNLLLAGLSTGNRVGVRAISHVSGQLDIVVGKLAELTVIETELLLLGRDAQRQAGDEVHEEQEDAREDKGPAKGGAGASNLVAKLDKVSINPTDGVILATVEVSDGLAGEELAGVYK